MDEESFTEGTVRTNESRRTLTLKNKDGRETLISERQGDGETREPSPCLQVREKNLVRIKNKSSAFSEGDALIAPAYKSTTPNDIILNEEGNVKRTVPLSHSGGYNGKQHLLVTAFGASKGYFEKILKNPENEILYDKTKDSELRGNPESNGLNIINKSESNNIILNEEGNVNINLSNESENYSEEGQFSSGSPRDKRTVPLSPKTLLVLAKKNIKMNMLVGIKKEPKRLPGGTKVPITPCMTHRTLITLYSMKRILSIIIL